MTNHTLHRLFRNLILLGSVFTFVACQPPKSQSDKPGVPVDATAAIPETPPPAEPPSAEWDVRNSLVRVNSTQQSRNEWQPWEKEPPQRRRALAAIVGPQLVVTTAELVANATYLEFESPDGSRFASARVIVADYEANLALLGPVLEKEGEAFFAGTVPFQIAKPPGMGSTLDVVQLEDNGLSIVTSGELQSVVVTSSFLPGHSFLTYLLKASMRSASSSFTLPVLQGRELAGVLLSYDSEDQLSNVVSTDVLARFINEAADGKYDGFPSLGISISRTDDGQFRQWLGLNEEQGGLYVRSVREGAAADLAGVRKGDVLLAIDGEPIDRRGFYQHPQYGNLPWGNLVRGEKSAGDKVALSLLREGEPLELEAVAKREEEEARLVPTHHYTKAPNYFIKGGMVFMELSRPVLESFGENWSAVAPLNLLDAFENPEDYQESMDRVVFLSGSIPTPATVGYEGLRNLIVKNVNGVAIRDMKTLKEAFENHAGEIHAIEFVDENLTVHLDELVSSEVDTQLLKRGIPRLSRTD